MQKTLLIIFILSMSCIGAFAQWASIRGSITDKGEKKPLHNASILVLRQSDSSLISFTRSKANGDFMISKLPSGKITLMASYPSYVDYVEEMTLSDTSVLDLGSINMIGKAELLQEVVVSNAAAIRIKGDTTEYKVDSFHLAAGATVEEMLSKLPGIQVDSKGKITAQGEKVQKVLVDGEEFFSDDPTIVTKNMLSASIDKVQVYDKKSDQAAFTGIDDGKKSKTIDLKLKDNRKKGYFGKAELGTNGKDYWNNSAMINAFKGKRKLSAFGIMSSTGKIGLDWQESQKYGASTAEMNYDNGMYYSMSSDDDEFGEGNYYGEGLPKGWNAGAMYANKWNGDKISVNGSYTYRKLNTASEGSIQSKYILPDTTYFINEKGNRFNSKYRNNFNGIYEYQLDSSSSIKVTGKGFFGNTISLSNSDAESLDESGRYVNTSQRHIYSKADNTSVSSSAIYRKKFKKQGRTFSINLAQNYSANTSAGSLMANYDFFDENGAIKRSDTTNQQKLKDNSNSTINTRFVYTEPLSKRAILEFNYGLSNTKGESQVSTFEKMSSASDKYDKPVDSLSSNYSLNVLSNSAGVNYRYGYPKKINFSFGGNIARADFSRKDIKGDSSLNYSFLNFFPRASLNMPAPGGGNIRFDYSGYTQAPSVNQLQPIRDNSDELNQYIGNPDLKQSFNQQYNLNYNTFKMLSERYIGTGLSFKTVNNDFSVNNFVDSLGKRLTQPVNVNGNRSFNMYIYYGKKLSKKGIYLNGEANISNFRNTNFINAEKNVNQNFSSGVSAEISYRKEKKWDIFIRNGINYNRTSSSIRPDGAIAFITHDHRVDFTFYLPAKLEIGSEANFSFRQKTDAFDRNANFVKWDARLERKFLKKDKGIIRLQAFDLLDQNIGFQRDIKSNFISEKTYNSFRRYFLLSLLVNFNNNETK